MCYIKLAACLSVSSANHLSYRIMIMIILLQCAKLQAFVWGNAQCWKDSLNIVPSCIVWWYYVRAKRKHLLKDRLLLNSHFGSVKTAIWRPACSYWLRCYCGCV